MGVGCHRGSVSVPVGTCLVCACLWVFRKNLTTDGGEGAVTGSSSVMDLIGGVGVPPSPPPCCDEASQYASQKNPVTD